MPKGKKKGGLLVNIAGSAEVKKAFERVRKAMPDVADGLILASGDHLCEQAQVNLRTMQPPGVDTEALVKSVAVTSNSNQQGHVISCTVGTALNYGPYIEYGTRPHFPPIQVLKEWCKRHDMPESAAYAIQKNIGERGTPPRPWLLPALFAERVLFANFIRDGIATNLPRMVQK